MGRSLYYPGTKVIFLRRMIQSLVLTGNLREYNRYLRVNKLKSTDNPQLTSTLQLRDYHELPPVVIFGTWPEKYSHIYRQLVARNADVVEGDAATA